MLFVTPVCYICLHLEEHTCVCMKMDFIMNNCSRKVNILYGQYFCAHSPISLYSSLVCVRFIVSLTNIKGNVTMPR